MQGFCSVHVVLRQGRQSKVFSGRSFTPFLTYTSLATVGPKSDTILLPRAWAMWRPRESLVTMSLQEFIHSMYSSMELSPCCHESVYFLSSISSSSPQNSGGQAFIGHFSPTWLLNPMSLTSFEDGLYPRVGISPFHFSP